MEKAALVWDRHEGQVESLKTSPILTEGAAAFAAKRAATERGLRSRFAGMWAHVAGRALSIVETDEGAEKAKDDGDNHDMHFTVAVDANSDDDDLRDLADSDEE